MPIKMKRSPTGEAKTVKTIYWVPPGQTGSSKRRIGTVVYWDERLGELVTMYRLAYLINNSITHGTLSGPDHLYFGDTTQVWTIQPQENYHYPSSISVVNASYDYNSANGEITLFNPTKMAESITIKATCPGDGVSVSVDMHNTGTASYYPSVSYGSNTIISFAAATKHRVPSVGEKNEYIRVTGGFQDWSYTVVNAGTSTQQGRIEIRGITSSIQVNVWCPEVSTLKAPVIELKSDMLKISDSNGADANKFQIFVDGHLEKTIQKT